MPHEDGPGVSRHHFEYMLVGLLVLLLVGPALRTFVPSAWSSVILWSTVGVAMAAGTTSLVSSRASVVAGCAVGAAFGVCGVTGTLLDVHGLMLAAACGFLLFCIWGIAASLRQVLIGPAVDLNRIAGAVCVYILLGMTWAVVYLLVAVTVEDAFLGLEGRQIDELWPQLSYFSFVTLTTLGYGDISPRIPLAGSLAYLEAIIGQLYIAILIAGLVGAHLNSRQR